MFEAGDRVECINDDWHNFLATKPLGEMTKLGSRWTVADVMRVNVAVPAVVAGVATIAFVRLMFISLTELNPDNRYWSEHLRKIEGGDGQMEMLTTPLKRPMPTPSPETVDA